MKGKEVLKSSGSIGKRFYVRGLKKSIKTGGICSEKKIINSISADTGGLFAGNDIDLLC
jgi:hypothetical protein